MPHPRVSAIFFLPLFFAGSLFSAGSLFADEFPKPFNTENPDAKLMSAEDALKGMTVPDGFKLTLFAAEPDINQPIAMATDDRDRLWVVENYTYAEASVNFDARMRDRVVILEDVDGNGSSTTARFSGTRAGV